MITTQRSESMNSTLKRYVTYKHDLLRFFHHFNRMLEDCRYEEIRADVQTSQNTHVASNRVEILKHAANVYTYEVFKLFEEELQKSYDSQVEFCGDIGDTSEYKVISFVKKYQHTVRYVSSQNTVSCSCKKFEFPGILCSHTLKILSLRTILRILENLIIKRWTKNAKKGIVDSRFSTKSVGLSEGCSEVDLKKMYGVQYRELCSLHNQLATHASSTDETFIIVKNGLLKLIGEVDMCLEKRKTKGSTTKGKCSFNHDDGSSVVAEQNSTVKACEKQNVVVLRDIEHQGFEQDKHVYEEMMIKAEPIVPSFHYWAPLPWAWGVTNGIRADPECTRSGPGASPGVLKPDSGDGPTQKGARRGRRVSNGGRM
ncbi:hypothetical protein C2S52_001189 [Perilla frutescens var. hirtella]|nr:hypothetical protein C2S52_001189 [Perilla frutescens var. hirtella]